MSATRRSTRLSTAIKSAETSERASKYAKAKAVQAAEKGDEATAQKYAGLAMKEAMKAKSVANAMKQSIHQSIKGSTGSRKSLSGISRRFGMGVSRPVARSLSVRNMARKQRSSAFRVPRSAVNRAASIAARAGVEAEKAGEAAVRAGNTMRNYATVRVTRSARVKRGPAKSKTAKARNNVSRHILPYQMSTQTHGSRMANKRQASARSARAMAHRFSSVKPKPYRHATPNTIRRMRQQQQFINRRFGITTPRVTPSRFGRSPRRSTPRRFGRSTRRLSAIREVKENNNNL